MGHPDSFQLEYLGVGNEQWQSDTVNFFGRYEMFEKAIHEKYPEIKLIGSAGPDVWSDGYKKAWAWASEAVKKNDNLVYAIDEHYYVSPEWLYDHVHFYDQYDRQIKVFAGEYACHIPGRAGRMNCPEANTLGAALAEAAFMTGLEKNADVVVLASYAPLLARMGYTQWSPDLIWFNGDTSYVTPSYYVQQLYSKYSGVKTLTADFGLDQETERKEGIYASAVEDEKGKLILKIVNSNEEEREMTIEDETGQIMGDIPYTTIVMSGEKEDRNTIQDREKVSLHREEKVLKENRIKVPGNSFSVILFDGKK